MTEPINPQPPKVEDFLTERLRIWKDLGEPAPRNELQSIAAWLRYSADHTKEEMQNTMRTRMLLLMNAANALHEQGPEAEAAAGIYDEASEMRPGADDVEA